MSDTNFRASIKSTAPGFKNVITGPAVPGKVHRLCSYTPGSSVTQQHDFGVSELWTTAIIRKPVDGEVGGGTIDFAEPKNEELGTVIGKSHKIQVRIGRASTRMGVYESVSNYRYFESPLGSSEFII